MDQDPYTFYQTCSNCHRNENNIFLSLVSLHYGLVSLYLFSNFFKNLSFNSACVLWVRASNTFSQTYSNSRRNGKGIYFLLVPVYYGLGSLYILSNIHGAVYKIHKIFIIIQVMPANSPSSGVTSILKIGKISDLLAVRRQGVIIRAVN